MTFRSEGIVMAILSDAARLRRQVFVANDADFARVQIAVLQHHLHRLTAEIGGVLPTCEELQERGLL
jgi:hypothetical protein